MGAKQVEDARTLENSVVVAGRQQDALSIRPVPYRAGPACFLIIRSVCLSAREQGMNPVQLEDILARLQELRRELNRRPEKATLRAIEVELGRLERYARNRTLDGVGADGDGGYPDRGGQDNGDGHLR